MRALGWYPLSYIVGGYIFTAPKGMLYDFGEHHLTLSPGLLVICKRYLDNVHFIRFRRNRTPVIVTNLFVVKFIVKFFPQPLVKSKSASLFIFLMNIAF